LIVIIYPWVHEICFSGAAVDVSALFGNVPISSFTLTMLDADSTRINFISYDLSQVIGGEILPLDTTALLLAGVQSISMWMIPVVAAGVGIGVFVIKRRK